MNWSGSLKLMDNDKRVQITGGRLYAVLPHPDGRWRNPPITAEQYEAAVAFVFAATSEHLSAKGAA